MALRRTGIADLLDELAAHTVETIDARFGLREASVPDDYRRREGRWAGQALVLETDLRDGRGPVAQLKLARIASPTDPDAAATLTLAVIPRCETGRPILGADLISFKGSFSLVGLDLTPMGRAPDDTTRARLGAVRQPLLRSGRAREPGPPFGPDAVFVTPPKGEVELPRLAFLTYLDAFCRELDASAAEEAPSVDMATVRGAQERYFQAMSTHMKELPVLGKFFGPDWVATYFDDVFFDRFSIR